MRRRHEAAAVVAAWRFLRVVSALSLGALLLLLLLQMSCGVGSWRLLCAQTLYAASDDGTGKILCHTAEKIIINLIFFPFRYAFLTYSAQVGFVARMRPDVGFQLLSREECLWAVVALVGSHRQMLPFPVVNERGEGAKTVAAVGTQETLLAGVDHHVDLALLEAGKRLGTELAFERFLAYSNSREMRRGNYTWE